MEPIDFEAKLREYTTYQINLREKLRGFRGYLRSVLTDQTRTVMEGIVVEYAEQDALIENTTDAIRRALTLMAKLEATVYPDFTRYGLPPSLFMEVEDKNEERNEAFEQFFREEETTRGKLTFSDA